VFLLSKEQIGPFRVPRPVMAVLNNMVYAIARAYTPKIALVKGIGPNSLIFESARIFPVHSLEWILAALEISIHHKRELSWIGDILEAKVFKATRARYGQVVGDELIDLYHECKKLKHLDWNRTMLELLQHIFSTGSFDKLSILDSIVDSVARKPWGTKDVMDITEQLKDIDRMKDVNLNTKVGMGFFVITGKASSKEKKHMLN